jgi:hypothetical protein
MLAFFNLSLLSNLTNPNKDTGMTKINSPPSMVDAMCGVDSLHIQMECSLYEITLFLREMKMQHKIIKKTKYTTEIEIILAGEKITAVSTARRRTTLEFGGLYYSRNSKVKLHFISDDAAKLPRIEIIDSALPKELELLENYSFSYTEEGVLTLDFDVKRGVEVSYSNENGANQIQLVMGNGTQTHFTKKYNASHGDDMNFNFIQGLTKSTDRKAPIVILLDGDED